jgi:K+-transporting ATPase KdpF subunit
MSLDYGVGLSVSVLIFAYLVFALLRPERF